MLQKIVGWWLDEHGDWVAVLGCGHGQHVRHAPPLSDRAWVLSEAGRSRFLGYELSCLRCNTGEPEMFRVHDGRWAPGDPSGRAQGL